jgi:hypothetical protein
MLMLELFYLLNTLWPRGVRWMGQKRPAHFEDWPERERTKFSDILAVRCPCFCPCFCRNCGFRPDSAGSHVAAQPAVVPDAEQVRSVVRFEALVQAVAPEPDELRVGARALAAWSADFLADESLQAASSGVPLGKAQTPAAWLKASAEPHLQGFPVGSLALEAEECCSQECLAEVVHSAAALLAQACFVPLNEESYRGY